MANVKISELTSAAALDGTEVLPVVQTATTKKTAVSTILTWIKTQAITWTAAHIFNVNSSGDAVRISQAGTGNALVVEDTANPDTTPFVVDAAGRTIIGHTVSIPAAVNIQGNLQVPSTTGSGASTALLVFSTSAASAPFLMLCHSKNATIGGHTLAASGDLAGNINFSCSDGVAFIRTAQITSEVDGTPGVNDMPGRLILSTTADGASAPTERMRINAAGNVLIGTTTDNGLDKLQVAGSLGLSGTLNLTSSSSNITNSNNTGQIDIQHAPADGTSTALVRVFRATNTTGVARFSICSGDGTAGINHDLVGKGSFTSLCRLVGNLLVGSTTDDTVNKLQVNGATRTAGNLTCAPAASVTPANNGDLTFEATSNTSLTFKYKGSDGVVRSASLVLV